MIAGINLGFSNQKTSGSGAGMQGIQYLDPDTLRTMIQTAAKSAVRSQALSNLYTGGKGFGTEMVPGTYFNWDVPGGDGGVQPPSDYGDNWQVPTGMQTKVVTDTAHWDPTGGTNYIPLITQASATGFYGPENPFGVTGGQPGTSPYDNLMPWYSTSGDDIAANVTNPFRSLDALHEQVWEPMYQIDPTTGKQIVLVNAEGVPLGHYVTRPISSGGGGYGPTGGMTGNILDWMSSEGYTPEEMAAIEKSAMGATQERLGSTASEAALTANATGDTAGYNALLAGLAGNESDAYAKTAADAATASIAQKYNLRSQGTQMAAQQKAIEDQNFKDYLAYIAQIAGLQLGQQQMGVSAGNTSGFNIGVGVGI